MNFDLTDEQLQVRDMVREFAQREVAPHIQSWDAKGEFHREVLDKMGELGIKPQEVQSKGVISDEQMSGIINYALRTKTFFR